MSATGKKLQQGTDIYAYDDNEIVIHNFALPPYNTTEIDLTRR